MNVLGSYLRICYSSKGVNLSLNFTRDPNIIWASNSDGKINNVKLTENFELR